MLGNSIFLVYFAERKSLNETVTLPRRVNQMNARDKLI